MTLKTLIEVVQETFRKWNQDKVSRLAAALAYYTIFSIAPLLVVAVAVAGAAFGQEAARGQIVGQIRGLVGTDGAQVIEQLIKSADEPKTGTFATIVGIITLVLGASGVFLALQDTLNTIWGVMVRPGAGIKEMLRSRLLSFGLVIAIGFLLLVSLVLQAALTAVSDFLNRTFPLLGVGLPILNFVISLAVITGLFAIMFKYLPDVQISWRDVGVGAFATSLLFTVGKILIGVYLGSSSTASVYGAAGSLVVLLLWIYYSAQILFLGAEFTQVYAMRFGSYIKPASGAMALTPEMRSYQGIPLAEDVKAAADLDQAIREK